MNFRKLSPDPMFIQCLSQEIRDDPLPVAVLWVETSLRPIWIRVIEYIYVKICKILAPNKAKQITIGLAQMKLCYWNEYMKTKLDKVPSIADLENPVINYHAIKWYFSRNGTVLTLLDVSRSYTGQINTYYATLLDEALTLLTSRA